MEISLTLAIGKDLQALHHFFVFYFTDLSEFEENIILNEYGLPTWAPDGLPGPSNIEECVHMNWWIRDSCLPYLIRVDSIPAGFTIICTDKAHLLPNVDFELMDFYIAPKFRRQGVGRRAANMAFNLFRGGIWQVYELERNFRARSFWKSVIEEYTKGNFQQLDNGTQQRFRN
jgi:predicted acetyltransferase